MSFTYAELKTAVQDYTENNETTFTNQLNTFIKNAEQRIFTEVQLSIFRKNALGAFTANQKFLVFPTDFLAAFSLTVLNNSRQEFLLRKNVTFIQTVNPNGATTGTPKYYSQYDNRNLIVAPTPDQAYETELHYYFKPDSLTVQGDSGTTWQSTKAPLALLYATLYEAYTFMKGEPDVLQNYQARYDEALSRLKEFGEADEVTDAYRMGLVMRQKS